MRLTGSRAYYRSTPPKMPSGLVELIEGLTREVLKNNPTNIYSFCADHVQQLLELRDGPREKKTLTLQQKIANAQEKVRKRAEQRRQQYDNDILIQQNCQINDPLIEDTQPVLSEELTPPHIPNTPHNDEQTLVDSSEVKLFQEFDKLSKDLQCSNSNEVIVKDFEDLKSEHIDEADESQSNIHAEILLNKTSDEIVTKDPTLNKPSETESLVTKLNTLGNNFCEPTTDGDIAHDGKELLEIKQDFVAETGVRVVQQYNEINSVKQNITSNPLLANTDTEEISSNEHILATIAEQTKNDKEVDESNSVISTEPVTDDNIFGTENAAELKDAEEKQNVDDNDLTKLININNVEEPINSDHTVNKNQDDPEETNTFNFSFKESPTVELQDPQISSEMLDSFMDTNSDSDILTLITQDSTRDELKQHAYKNGSESELHQFYNDDSKSNISISTCEEFQEKQRFNLFQNDIEQNNGKDNSNGNILTKLGEKSQILNHPDNNMDLETAAVTIQKVFRTFLFKNRASTFDDTISDQTIFLNEGDKNKEECDYPITGSMNERRPHGITRMDTVLQTVNEEKSLSLSTDDSSTLSSAATVIQAHVRGFLVRNKLHSNKTVSSNSLAASNSNEPSLTSLEMDNEQNKNKTVLNIHIVPEGGNYLSRDESLITSMELSLDSSPPSSINLHPLGYDKSERRKQLKREDAIQSISPPSNNSGKLSEDVDSVKELPLNDHEMPEEPQEDNNDLGNSDMQKDTCEDEVILAKTSQDENMVLETIDTDISALDMKQNELREKVNSDEMDVVTPLASNESNSLDRKLIHSGEFHEAVLPTKVSRSDSSVASEFKNVLVYFLLWNHS